MNAVILLALLLPGCVVFLDFPGKDEPADTDTDAPDPADTDTDPADTDTGAVDTDTGDTVPGTDTGDTVPGTDTGDTVDTGYVVDTAWIDTGGEPVSELCTDGVAAFLVGSGTTYGRVDRAVADAVEGDIVQVCPGRWTTHAEVGVGITIAGYGPRRSFLAGAYGGRVLLVDGEFDLTVRDLTIMGGRSLTEGGCIRASGGADLVMERAQVASCFATTGGGLHMTGRATLDATDTTFRDNVVDGDGGAIWLQGTSWIWLTDSAIIGNEAEYGGGIFIDEDGYGSLSLVRTELSENFAVESGGAVVVDSYASTTILAEDTTFARNSSLSEGGAVYLNGRGTPTFEGTRVTFDANDSYVGGALAFGTWDVTTVRLVDSTLTGNTAHGAAAIRVNGQGQEVLEITGGSVVGNVAVGGPGALSLDDDVLVTVTGVDFGEGSTDNEPYDVHGGLVYGSAASFSCTGETCE